MARNTGWFFFFFAVDDFSERLSNTYDVHTHTHTFSNEATIASAAKYGTNQGGAQTYTFDKQFGKIPAKTMTKERGFT